jgi:uncharacterized protein YpmS
MSAKKILFSALILLALLVIVIVSILVLRGAGGDNPWDSTPSTKIASPASTNIVPTVKPQDTDISLPSDTQTPDYDSYYVYLARIRMAEFETAYNTFVQKVNEAFTYDPAFYCSDLNCSFKLLDFSKPVLISASKLAELQYDTFSYTDDFTETFSKVDLEFINAFMIVQDMTGYFDGLILGNIDNCPANPEQYTTLKEKMQNSTDAYAKAKKAFQDATGG